MTNRSKWVTPIFGFVLGSAMAAVEYHRNGSAGEAIAVFAIVIGYSIAVLVLQSRSEVAGLFAGLPVDERWHAINEKALAATAQVLAVVLVVSFLGVELTGGDAMPYAWTASVLALAYFVSTLWYRWRS
jgi:uncharacterized membrane protein